MIFEAILCPFCKGADIIKAGISIKTGKQRYKCKNSKCATTTFIKTYSYNGSQPEVKAKIVEMALNGSGIRDTARVLKISPSTVISELKKRICNRKSKY